MLEAYGKRTKILDGDTMAKKSVRTDETANRFPTDQKLRAWGFEIVRRRQNKIPVWRLRVTGEVMSQSEAVDRIAEMEEGMR